MGSRAGHRDFSSRAPRRGDEAGRESAYVRLMHTFASIAIGLLMFATVGVLFAGMIGMVRGNSGAASNKLMRYRVLLQGATILLLVLFMNMLRS
jgi:Hypoxia induced protein conserved region